MTPRLEMRMLAIVATVGCAATTQSASTVTPCEGRRMATVVNLSTNAVEAVAVRGGVETLLVLAPPGLASRPFRPPLPDERYMAGGQGRATFWYIRDATTGRRVAPRDPKVRTEWVCVAEDAA
jgi:hypothetical protein